MHIKTNQQKWKQLMRLFRLLVIAGLGLAMVLDCLVHTNFTFKNSLGVAVLVLSVFFALLLLRAIQKENLPLASWYLLPVICGIGSGVFASLNSDDWLFYNVYGAMFGIGIALISFACLQFWVSRSV